MNMPSIVLEPVLAQTNICKQQRKQLWLWLAAATCFICVIQYVHVPAFVPENLPLDSAYIPIIMGVLLIVILAVKGWQYRNSNSYLIDYDRLQSKLNRARNESSVGNIQKAISQAAALESTNHLIPRLLEYYRPELCNRMTELHRQFLVTELEKEHAALEESCRRKIQDYRQEVPLVKVKDRIASSLGFLTRRRREMADQWDAAFQEFSWWNKMKYSGGPDFREIDKAINQLSTLERTLLANHSDDLKALDEYLKKFEKKALSRLAAARVEASRYIQNCDHEDELGSSVLEKALWFSAMSVPVSLWSDLDSAASVYDALRAVNSNFSAMSDMEIWWESLFMPAESLSGLVALTKGAYFERLVAEDTGGELFQHFNNPDTDIVIDGVAFQLKATASAEYVNSVDESIPVIATTEVAIATGAIDGGYSNEDLTNAVDNALGGTIVDIGDTTLDSILAGLGGLGIFATIEGINHACRKYENGGDGVEAVFEGAGVAIEGTARALVGAAEMGYNVLASRPSRFVGRTLLSGMKKLDDKMMEAGNRK